MKALVSRPVLYFSLAIVLLGGSGWTIYSKFFVPTDKTPVAATSDQEDSEGTKSVDEEQDVTVSPPDSDAFSRLAPSSDGSDGDFQLASEPTLTVDTADSDSFVIDNTLPAPLDNGGQCNLI